MDNNLSTEKWIDITEESKFKIYKQIQKAGIDIPKNELSIPRPESDNYPKKGSRVIINLTGISSQGVEFINVENLHLNLFVGETIKGLDLAICTMKSQEISEFKIDKEYVTDDIFNDYKNKIPRNQSLRFLVFLQDWDDEYLTRKNDAGVVRKIFKKGIGYETPVLDSIVNINLIGYTSKNEKFIEKNNFKFKLGEGCDSEIPEGVELALFKMKIDEKNRVYIDKDYTFNKEIAIKISSLPSNYDRLIYDVELLSFTRCKQIWEMNLKERLDKCLAEKDKGSVYFKNNNLPMAMKCYSNMLKLLGPPKILDFGKDEKKVTELIITSYNNLSLIYLKLKKPKEAIKYSDYVLALDPSNLKATYRKGLANFDRSDYNTAINYFDLCLSLDASNKSAINSKKLCLQKIENYKNKEKKIFKNLFEALANDKEIQSLET